MAELDRFEARFAAAYRRYLEEGPVEVDAGAVARRAAVDAPRRQAWVAGFRPFGLSPALAWLLLLSALLLALTIGSLVTGGWRPDLAILLGPSPSPAATAAPGEDEGTDILATTKAKPLPARATCPAGSDPNAPGPADQERPSAYDAGSMAFDRHAGRIVLLAHDDYSLVQRDPPVWGSHTWTFDVCTNTWQRMSPPDEPPASAGAAAQLVYDADSDRTVAFDADGTAWSYDLAADRWTQGSRFVEAKGVSAAVNQDRAGVSALYHDPSGLVIVYDGVSLWAYDVDTDTMAKVRQRPDPSRPEGSGAPGGSVDFSPVRAGYDSLHDVLVVYGMPGGAEWQTWTFDVKASTWRFEASAETPRMRLVLPAHELRSPSVGTGAVFDEASALTLFNGHPSSPSELTDTQVDAYDAGQNEWRTLDPGIATSDRTFLWCESSPPVYDPLNGRAVCRGGIWDPDFGFSPTGVAAFSAGTGEWRWLLEPEPLPAPISAPTPAPATGAFSPTGSMTAARFRAAATLLADGRALVVGGSEDVAAAEIFDPPTGAFSPTGAMSITRTGATATLLADGRVLVIGGWHDPDYLASAEIFDPPTGTFSPTGPMTTARDQHLATLLRDGRVLVVGGLNGSGYLASAEIYDPKTGTFSPTGSMSVARERHTVTLLADGRVLVVGGSGPAMDVAEPVHASAEVYDARTGEFSPTGSMTTRRDDHTATLLEDGRILVAGGNGLAAAEIYDPKTGTFGPTGSMSGAHAYHTATLLADGRVLVAGGIGGAGTATAEIFDPSTGTFSPTGPMATSRSHHTATLLPDGRVLITGGSEDVERRTAAEIYKP